MPFVFSQYLDPKLMAASLATTLTTYPLFAGRLRIDADKDYAVELNGAGASFTTATCTSKLEDTLPKAMDAHTGLSAAAAAVATNGSGNSHAAASTSAFAPQDISSFLPKAPLMVLGYRNKDVPLLHAQLTALHNGGTVLGIVVPHVMADQDTLRTLLKCWAQNYTIALIEKKKMDLGVQPTFASATGDGTADGTAGSPILAQNMVGEILEHYAAPRLPPGWESSRFEKRTWSYLPKMIGTAVLHSILQGGPVAVAYHVPAARLAELKEQATNALASSGPGSPEWVSTKDALAARIRQMLADLPGKSGKKELQLVVDLRKRVNPQISPNALGNCSWTVGLPVIQKAQHHHRKTAVSGATAEEVCEELGAMAGQIRTAINNIMEKSDISNELKWLKDNVKGGANMPVVYQNFSDTLHSGGPLLLSHWTWGENSYEDLQFGGGEYSAPVWHQPCFDRVPNTAFVVPAAAAAPGGGILVHITLHKQLAKKLIESYPTL